MKCKECGYKLNKYGVCENCGLFDDEIKGNYQDEDIYPYDEEELTHYGDPRGQGVSNIAVMTKVNLAECENPDLKRALKWDTNYEWDVVKTEIINKSIKETCKKLGLNKDFRENVMHFFRKIKNKDSIFGELTDDFKLTGKLLEDIGITLVYLIIRLDGCWNLTFLDFERVGKRRKNLFRYYVFFVKKFNLYKRIKRQNPKHFLSKIINSLIPDNTETYRVKFELSLILYKLFFGLYGVKLEEEDHITDIGDYLKQFGALIYFIIKGIEHPFVKFNDITQSEICEAAQCTEVTIREHINKTIVLFKKFEEGLL